VGGGNFKRRRRRRCSRSGHRLPSLGTYDLGVCGFSQAEPIGIAEVGNRGMHGRVESPLLQW